MQNIAEQMKTMPGFCGGNGAPQEEIDLAQSTLGVRFSDEYLEYLRAFGVASVGSHELTGVTGIERLDVVGVTQRERALNPDVPSDWYVVEDTGIDGIVIWQDRSGRVYQTVPGCEATDVADSLLDALRLWIE
ncbi:MAG: SMI1/KNR4 family protein [Coriobacteriales bacterium]|jgi:hypothetical protein